MIPSRSPRACSLWRHSAPLALASAILFLTTTADAQVYPPELRFRTIETAHFLVHHHDGTEDLAQRAAVLAERAHDLLVPEFGHTPREKTHVVLVDVDDSANGSATSIPYNTIRLNAATPEPRGVLNDFDDYLWILIVHEYAHVLHLDTVRGLPALGNRIFGKQLSPNATWPSFFIEGLAVHHESKYSEAGRLRSSLHEMELRTHLLEGREFDFPVLTGNPLTWPRRDAWYLYGGRFVDHLSRTYGEDLLTAMSQENAPRVWPYLLHETARRHTGKTLDALYREWLDAERERAEAFVRSRLPLSREERLTHIGETRRSPRLSHDGTLLYSLLLDANQRPRLMAYDVATGVERKIVDVNGDGTLAVLPDGRILASQPDFHRNFRWYDDLFVIDPERRTFHKITHGARLSEPDVSSDGRVASIRRSGAGITELVVFESLEEIASTNANGGRVLRTSAPGEPLASPRFSPDGRWIVFSVHRNGAWNLSLASLDDGTVTPLTDDGAQDITPAFTRDGKRVLFSSDRTGAYDVYALDLETWEVEQLTRVAGGAFEPLDTEDGLVFLVYGALGFDLARRVGDFAIAAPEAMRRQRDGRLEILRRDEIPDSDLTESDLTESDLTESDCPEPDHTDAEETSSPLPSRPYSPWSSLKPAYWLPTFSQDPAGYTLGVTTTGYDVLRRWRWAASIWYGLSSHEPGASLSLRTDALRPALTLQFQRRIDFVPGFGTHYGEEAIVGRLTADWIFRRRWSTTHVVTGWDLGHLSPASFVDPSADAPTPERGLVSTALVSLSHSNVRRFAHSISNAEGTRLTLDLRASGPYTGSDFSHVLMVGGFTGYVPMPVRHHVLAVQASLGVGFGDFGRRAFFGLGGPLVGGVDFAGFQSRFPFRLLRGYPPLTFVGPAFALTNLEYRFPIASPEAGVTWFPLLLRRLHGAVFTDVGTVFDPEQLGSIPSPATGSGVELRAEFTVGYRLETELRIGYARGWSAGGVHQLILLIGANY